MLQPPLALQVVTELAADFTEGGGADLADDVEGLESGAEIELILSRTGGQIEDQRTTGAIVIDLIAAGVPFEAGDGVLFREVGGGGDGQESLGGSAAVRKGDEPTGHAVGGIQGPAGAGDVLELQGVVTGEEGERVSEASGAAGNTDGGIKH